MQAWRRVETRALSETGYAIAERGKPKRPPAQHPALKAVIEDATVTRLIGRPTPLAGDEGWPDPEAPSWVRLERVDGERPVLKLGFRGALLRTVFTRELGEHDNNVRRVEHVESDRLYDFDALKQAVAAAREALRAAGVGLTTFFEVEQNHGGQSATAQIGLKALSTARGLGATLAR